MLTWLREHPGDAGWGFYYLARRMGLTRVDCSSAWAASRAGRTRMGTVEVGYAVVDEHRRQGYATEAVVGWTRFAFESPRVARVIGQTLPSLGPSIRVLGKPASAPPARATIRTRRRASRCCGAS